MTRRPGFTMIELVMVILLAGILGGIAVPQMTGYASQREARNARDAFISTASRARAAAIQSGDEVHVKIYPIADRVEVVNRAGEPVGMPLDFRTGPVRARILGEFNMTICYTARGFVRPGTNCMPMLDIAFASMAGRDTARARVTFGQVERR
jgi:prepilin-type N-terminal cleavage/methylation domain-containing protein